MGNNSVHWPVNIITDIVWLLSDSIVEHIASKSHLRELFLNKYEWWFLWPKRRHLPFVNRVTIRAIQVLLGGVL